MSDDAPRGEEKASRDYRDTVFLPETSFPMRGELPRREPELLARWARLDLYRRLREDSKGCKLFVLHDGPPYANGHLHIGTGLNKILKDIVNRVHQMKGEDANYVPGWDCHGLPIEWKIEEEYRAKNKHKEMVPILEFRAECRAFAEQWLGIQREEFQRLGVIGDWSNPYATMTHLGEAQIVREIWKFAANGMLYRGARPVMWSVVEKTALAEAEIEYHEHKSDTIWARFPVIAPTRPELAGASIVIWTTTPWTIPANRALAVAAEVDYVVAEVTATAEGSAARSGEKLVVAAALLADVVAKAKAEAKVVATLTGAELVGTRAAHPWRGWAPGEGGYDFDVKVFAGGNQSLSATAFSDVSRSFPAPSMAMNHCGVLRNTSGARERQECGYSWRSVPLASSAPTSASALITATLASPGAPDCR